MTAAETENGRLALRSSNNALGRRSENLVSRNGRAVAGGMARGNVDSSPHRPAGRTRRNAAPDSGWPEHPDTDYHLPQGVRALILALARFETASKDQTRALEKDWAAYRKQHRLDIEGRALVGVLQSCPH